MKKQELDKLSIVRDGFIFTPKCNYTEVEVIDEKTKEKTKEFDYTVIATAKEVYQEYLAQKNAIVEPSLEERTKALEDALLMLL